jgi:hypothetical protein
MVTVMVLEGGSPVFAKLNTIDVAITPNSKTKTAHPIAIALSAKSGLPLVNAAAVPSEKHIVIQRPSTTTTDELIITSASVVFFYD